MKKITFLILVVLISVAFTSIVSADTIYVAGTNDAGVKWVAPESGIYRFTIVSGAVSPYPSDDISGMYWDHVLHIFNNSPIRWEIPDGVSGRMGPGFDYYLGDGVMYSSSNAAETAGIGKYVTIPMDVGKYVILITPDVEGEYYNDRGGITVSISKLDNPDASFKCLPENPTIIDQITCTPKIVDNDGKTYNYLWQSENGEPYKDRVFLTNFPKVGYYKINLTVTSPAYPILTSREEQTFLSICGGSVKGPIGIDLGKKSVNGCGVQVTSESGEYLQVCEKNNPFNAGYYQKYMIYYGPVIGHEIGVGRCDYLGGANDETYYYADNNNNPQPDCFLSTKFINKDYAEDDDARSGGVGDQLLDWRMTTLDLRSYNFLVINQNFNYKSPACIYDVCVAYDDQTYKLACSGNNKKSISCSKMFVFTPPEGSHAGTDVILDQWNYLKN
jgi:hypothetical protein